MRGFGESDSESVISTYFCLDCVALNFANSTASPGQSSSLIPTRLSGNE